MKFINKRNNGIEVQFEETDTDNKKRILEHESALIRNILAKINQVKI